MGVRNCEELGRNLQKIMNRLLANQNLLKLLYYTDKDPLSHEDFTKEEIREKFFEKLIRIIPKVGPKETANSIVVLRVESGDIKDNDEFRDFIIKVESFVPMTQWIIKDSNLRPFAILGEIQKSLSGKTINGLGKIVGGDFDLNFVTEEISCYEQGFMITAYD